MTGRHWSMDLERIDGKPGASVPSRDRNGEWVQERIILKPLNPAYEPIILEPEEEGQVLAIADFEVVGSRIK